MSTSWGGVSTSWERERHSGFRSLASSITWLYSAHRIQTGRLQTSAERDQDTSDPTQKIPPMIEQYAPLFLLSRETMPLLMANPKGKGRFVTMTGEVWKPIGVSLKRRASNLMSSLGSSMRSSLAGSMFNDREATAAERRQSVDKALDAAARRGSLGSQKNSIDLDDSVGPLPGDGGKVPKISIVGASSDTLTNEMTCDVGGGSSWAVTGGSWTANDKAICIDTTNAAWGESRNLDGGTDPFAAIEHSQNLQNQYKKQKKQHMDPAHDATRFTFLLSEKILLEHRRLYNHLRPGELFCVSVSPGPASQVSRRVTQRAEGKSGRGGPYGSPPVRSCGWQYLLENDIERELILTAG